MKKDIQKVAMASENIENDNLQKLRAVFPQFIKDGSIDFDALQVFFKKEGILAGTEKYGLSWAGKSKAFGDISRTATGTLTPQPKESKNWDTTENIFIEGENLEVLKLLQKKYANPGKIKMCYIDPPYNTGKDFVYKDNFTQNVSDYYEQSGQSKDGIKLTSNPESNGRYHSDWLTMMYSRLFLARNLLTDDGIIFVSIDDNEVANLRIVMGEVFGEENFIAQIIWERSFSPVNLKKYFSESHDYIICYAKNLNSIDSLTLARTDEANERYHNPDSDPRGVWTSGDFSVGPAVQGNIYEIIIPSGRKVLPPNGRSWRVSEEKFNELRKDNKVWFGEDGEGVPRQKRFLTDVKDGITPMTLWKYVEVGHSQEATKNLKDLFDDRQFFDYPKPVGLIKKCISLSAKEHDIILDFFSGSGTTAHAVMELNAEDGENRKWICVQMPELTEEDSEAYKAGYKNIAEIARERIRRAGEKIKKDNKEKECIEKLDIGFKALSLSSSNYRKWNTLTEEDDEKALLKQAKLFLEKPLVDGYDEKSVVYEILEKEGFDLNSFVQAPKKNQKDLPLWVVVDKGEKSGKMTITFAKKVTKEAIAKTGIGETDNEIFVCFDSALDDTTKVNIMRNLTVKTI